MFTQEQHKYQAQVDKIQAHYAEQLEKAKVAAKQNLAKYKVDQAVVLQQTKSAASHEKILTKKEECKVKQPDPIKLPKPTRWHSRTLLAASELLYTDLNSDKLYGAPSKGTIQAIALIQDSPPPASNTSKYGNPGPITQEAMMMVDTTALKDNSPTPKADVPLAPTVPPTLVDNPLLNALLATLDMKLQPLTNRIATIENQTL